MSRFAAIKRLTALNDHLTVRRVGRNLVRLGTARLLTVSWRRHLPPCWNAKVPLGACSENECRWIVGREEFERKAHVLRQNTLFVQSDVAERYSRRRRLQEDAFHDELFARLEFGIEQNSDAPWMALPSILSRMREFWIFKDVLYLSQMNESEPMFTMLLESGSAGSVKSDSMMKMC